MGMMTGSGECWSGDCDHPTHLNSNEKIEQLKDLLVIAVENDPSKHVNGVIWHEQVQRILDLL